MELKKIRDGYSAYCCMAHTILRVVLNIQTPSASAAKDIVANYDTEEEQVNATRKAVELAEKQGKRTVTNKEINAVQKEAKEAKEIAQALRKVWAYLDGGVMVDVDKLAILLDKTESLSNAMKQYKKLSK